MEGATILVVDDDPDFCEQLADWFEPLGCRVLQAHSGSDGLRVARSQRPDALILDIRMPGMDGYEVLKTVRDDEALAGIVVVVFSVTGEVLDKRIRSLRLGADHILPKTENLLELEAVVRRELERRHSRRPTRASASNVTPLPSRALPTLSYDADDVVVCLDGQRQDVRLTPLEARLLACLWQHRGRLVTRDMIAEEVYDDAALPDAVSDQAIDRVVGRLRHKIEPDVKAPVYIVTVRGHGYRLVPEGQPPAEDTR